MNKTIQHDTSVEAREKFLESLDNACANGRWLAVAFAVLPDGTLQLHRTTYNFPVEQMDAALNMLRQNLDRERGGHRPTPLPLAAHLQQNNGNGQGIGVYQEEAPDLIDPLVQGQPDTFKSEDERCL